MAFIPTSKKIHIYFQITLNQLSFFLYNFKYFEMKHKYNCLDHLFHVNVQKFEIILKYVSRTRTRNKWNGTNTAVLTISPRFRHRLAPNGTDLLGPAVYRHLRPSPNIHYRYYA